MAARAVKSRFVFVIMPFEDSMRDLYELGIKPACQAAGADCARLDEQIFGEGMLERIYGQLAAADVVVAEMTRANRNVYYEAGYAHGLRKPVIFLTTSVEDIPFDLTHYQHLVHGGSISEVKTRLEPQVRYYLEHPDEVADRMGASDPAEVREHQLMLRHLENYLHDREKEMISFDAIRSRIDEDWTDEQLRRLIKLNPDRIRRATLKGGKPGIKLLT
jgi:hypothetical protein